MNRPRPTHVVTALKAQGAELRSWAVVGKGPSFSVKAVQKALYDGLSVCAINNVPMVLPVGTLVHLVVVNDMDSLAMMPRRRCPADVQIVAVPSGYHDNEPRELLWQAFAGLGVAQWADLVTCYDMHTLNNYPDFPAFDVSATTTEAAVQALAHAGVTEMHFIGVDGGQPHASEFETRIDQTALDCQFVQLDKFRKRFRLTYTGSYT